MTEVIKNAIWEKCARQLSLNTRAELGDLQDILTTICKNIADNPSEPKYRTIKFNNKTVQHRVVPRKGGLEFLGAVGFVVEVVDGQKVLQFDMEGITEEAVPIIVYDGLNWLNTTVATCISIAEVYNRNAEDPCADCIIHLRLSTGASVYGGFARDDTVGAIHSYACCFYSPEKAATLSLRQLHNAEILGEEIQGQSIEQAGLYPRSTLVVSIQSDEGRVAAVQEVHTKVEVDLKTARENAEKIRKEKVAAVEKRKTDKERIIGSFREDREDRKDRDGFK